MLVGFGEFPVDIATRHPVEQGPDLAIVESDVTVYARSTRVPAASLAAG
jgi:hypothetical protein